MRNDLATLGRHTQPNIVTEEEKRLVIVAARLSGIELQEVARRTGLGPNSVRVLIDKFATEAEKFRQDLRNDAELMKLCGFDALYPGKVGDTRVNKVMMEQASPIFPKTRKKKRAKGAVRSSDKETIKSESPGRVLPHLGAIRSFPSPTRSNNNAMEQSVLACAKYVLDKLEK